MLSAWALVKGFTLSYHNKETILFTIDPCEQEPISGASQGLGFTVRTLFGLPMHLHNIGALENRIGFWCPIML